MDDGLSERRKRLVYRSAYTGTKETDLLLGYFAAHHIETFARLFNLSQVRTEILLVRLTSYES